VPRRGHSADFGEESETNTAGELREETTMKRSDDFSHARRGAVVSVPKGKTRITIRIDDDILDWFRDQVNAAGGGNYQTMINNVLRDYIDSREVVSLEKTLRRVIREELRKRGAA
jgi:uncharacterized protein (DUF4415 family)